MLTVICQPSWDSMVAWITAAQGELEEVVANRQYCGPVLKVSDHHAVQKIGRRTYTVHSLSELDKVPALNRPATIIRYSNGCGFILAEAPHDNTGVHHERDILTYKLKKALAR